MKQIKMNQTPLQRRRQVVSQFQLSRALEKPMKTLGALAAAAVMLPSVSALALEVDLTAAGDTSLHAVPGDVGGNGLVQNFTSHPSGTGVFDPFLTLERTASGGNPNGIERAYNTDGHSALYLDQQRPQWNTLLTLGDLAVVNVNGGSYYAFELDANEPGGKKSLLSVDNIRIYTSSSDNTMAVQNNEANLDALGSLRWAMNDPLKIGNNYNADTWIRLDANLSDQLKKANGGSGYSDLLLYVPTSAFAGALATDFVWFYNLNGVHQNVDGDLAAQSGYEEWRAALGPGVPPPGVPDGGATLILLGSALTGLFSYRRFVKLS